MHIKKFNSEISVSFVRVVNTDIRLAPVTIEYVRLCLPYLAFSVVFVLIVSMYIVSSISRLQCHIILNFNIVKLAIFHETKIYTCPSLWPEI